jgi:hypothetical protein
MGGIPGKPMYRNVSDIVGSGIAVGNGVVYFTSVGKAIHRQRTLFRLARVTVTEHTDFSRFFSRDCPC